MKRDSDVAFLAGLFVGVVLTLLFLATFFDLGELFK